MKTTIKISSVAFMLLMASTAFAFGDADSTAQAGAIAVAGSSSSASNRNSNRASASQGQLQGQVQGQLQGQVGNTTDVNVSDNSVYGAADVGDIAPSISAPNLVAGATTCLGSASGGVTVGGFGLMGGKTTLDVGCQAINGSIRFAQLGLNDAAVQVMCNVPMYAETLAETGYSCTESEGNSVTAIPATTYTSSARTGMFGH